MNELHWCIRKVTQVFLDLNGDLCTIDAHGCVNPVQRVCPLHAVLSSQWTICVRPWSFDDPNPVSSDCLLQLEEPGRARGRCRTRFQTVLLASNLMAVLQRIRGHQATSLVKSQCSDRAKKKSRIISTSFCPFAIYVECWLSYKEHIFPSIPSLPRWFI